MDKQTKKYVATLALNEYLLSRREVSYSASIFINQSPEKIEKKNRKLNEIKQPRPPFGRLNESSLSYSSNIVKPPRSGMSIPVLSVLLLFTVN